MREKLCQGPRQLDMPALNNKILVILAPSQASYRVLQSMVNYLTFKLDDLLLPMKGLSSILIHKSWS